ncbi:Cytosolic beta-glucosidase [Nibea albiflora]|uniref:Cytosolic beta-glucosidase n=1 Tax=Nibea albiflora TaxID=240163 RepID=A0ACB7EWI0_NIBAL|nr:Cytosolic beta-glucosidase [Nibea albiflora]
MFPCDFAWGAGTAAYQIEGGWQADGKGPSIWDTFCHEKKGRVFGDQNGDVSCNSYELWEKDLECIQQLGLTHYRLSLSWARLLPDGTTRHVNQKGVQYYNKVIDGLLACNVSPMVTLYHFDLPQALQDQGGWKSPGIATLFDSYAKFCFQTFGDRVKLWLTINEPYVCAKLGHEDGIHAPGLKEPGIAAYLAGHNMLRAHAMAWHSYNSTYRATQKGAVSLAINSDWLEPSRAEIMRSAIDAQSKKLGYNGSSRLPSFSKEEPAILGTADFFALNYYTSRKVEPGGGCGKALSMKTDRDAAEVLDPSWPICGVSWLAVVPYGLRKLLKYIKYTCNNPAVYITENGFSQVGPLQIEDVQRSEFYKDTVLEVAKAIQEDGVNVRGYFAWSLLDNFEWADGFSVRFGLFHVDFADANRRRRMYHSGREYAKLISEYKTLS